jgi:hypothetical protein
MHGPSRGQSTGAVEFGVYSKTLTTEVEAQQVRDRPFVFDDEDETAFAHGLRVTETRTFDGVERLRKGP